MITIYFNETQINSISFKTNLQTFSSGDSSQAINNTSILINSNMDLLGFWGNY